MTELNLDFLLRLVTIGIFGVKPYLKFSYIIIGATTFKGLMFRNKSYIEAIYKNSGDQLSAGLEYSILPLISALFEVESQILDLKVDELKGLPSGSSISDSK